MGCKKTYKKNKGYFPGIATIGNKIVGIENRDGNVKFKQKDTLERFYTQLESEGISINRSRMDGGSYQRKLLMSLTSIANCFTYGQTRALIYLNKSTI